MLGKIFLTLSLFLTICEGIYLNPYSVGSYDPAAENPYYYQYYGRYYNPNPHNPYAPYPTYLKKGYFTLPRMYQIDPSWTQYYPGSAGRNVAPNSPDYFNYPNYPGDTESIAIFPDECGSSTEDNFESQTNTQVNPPLGSPRGTVIGGRQSAAVRSPGYILHNSPRYNIAGPQRSNILRSSGAPLTETQMLLDNLEDEDRPKWSDTVPTDDVLMNFAKPATLVRPRVPRNSGSTQSGQQYNIQGNADGPSDYVQPRDFERLPIDRISFNQNRGTNDGSTYVGRPR